MGIQQSVWVSSRGLSLVELMIALAIGAVLSLAVSNLFLDYRIRHLQGVELGRLQENGRYALRYLSREMELAGFLGRELEGDSVRGLQRGEGCFQYLLEAGVALEHHDNVGTPGTATTDRPRLPVDCLAGRSPVVGSDVLVLRRTLDSPAVILGEITKPPDPNTLYLSVGKGGSTSALVPGRDLGPSADAWEYWPQVLFLRSYSRFPWDGIPTLCRLRLAPGGRRMAPLECLVEGIEDLQVEFGVDRAGDGLADRYLQAAGKEDMGRAVSARISLLVRAVRPMHGYRNQHGYQLGSKWIAPSYDAFYRRVVQSTVLLRNAGGLGL